MTYDAEFDVKQSTAQTTPATTFSVAMPASLTAGDMLIVDVATNTAAPTFTPSTASGTWTQIIQKANTSNGASITRFWKLAAAADVAGTAQTWTISSGGSRSTVTVRAYSDVEIATPVDVASVSANGSSTAPAATTLTPTAGNTTGVSVVGYLVSIAAASPVVPPVWTTPTGYGNAETIGTGGTSGTGNCFAATYDKKLASAAATGTITSGLTISRSWAAIHTVLRQKTFNSAPTIDFGSDQSVAGGDTVTLTATTSDPDGDPVTVTATQISGSPVVTLTDVSPGVWRFNAPNAGGTMVFQATATDGTLNSSDTVNVTVTARSSWQATRRASSVADWTTATASPTVTIPAAVHFGDVVYIFHVVNGIQTATTPTGWTKLVDQANTSSGATLRIYRKTMDPTNDAGATITLALSSTGRSYVECIAYYDVNPTTPEDVTTVVGTGTSTSATAPTATTVTAAAMSVVAYATSLAVPATDLAWTTPTGYTDPLLGNTTATTGAGNVYLATFDKLLTAAGPTGTVVSTINQSRQWVGVQLDLRPKSGNTPPVPLAGADIADVEPYSTVTVAGSAQDADGDTVTMTWAQNPADTVPVTLDDNGSGVATFSAPPILAGTTTRLVLTANDGTDTATDSVSALTLCHNHWIAVSGAAVPTLTYVAT